MRKLVFALAGIAISSMSLGNGIIFCPSYITCPQDNKCHFSPDADPHFMIDSGPYYMRAGRYSFIQGLSGSGSDNCAYMDKIRQNFTVYAFYTLIQLKPDMHSPYSLWQENNGSYTCQVDNVVPQNCPFYDVTRGR